MTITAAQAQPLPPDFVAAALKRGPTAATRSRQRVDRRTVLAERDRPSGAQAFYISLQTTAAAPRT